MSLPYMPFISQYWHVIATGIICYLAARLIFQTSSVIKNHWSRDNAKKHQRNFKNEDLSGKESIDENAFGSEVEAGNVGDITTPIPWDLEHIPLEFMRLPINESLQRSKEFFLFMNERRTVRHFSPDPVPIDLLRNIVMAAGTSPSGAHTEPWTFVLVSDMKTKEKIREIVENEEETNYEKRMGDKWVSDIKFTKTTFVKDYLTTVPYLILVFKQTYSYLPDGTKKIHYYNDMSVSIASGILLTAIHYAGLVTLISTPMNSGPALRTLLGRPSNEKLTLLLPVGYPAEDASVPDLQRKPLDEILVEF